MHRSPVQCLHQSVLHSPVQISHPYRASTGKSSTSARSAAPGRSASRAPSASSRRSSRCAGRAGSARQSTTPTGTRFYLRGLSSRPGPSGQGAARPSGRALATRESSAVRSCLRASYRPAWAAIRWLRRMVRSPRCAGTPGLNRRVLTSGDLIPTPVSGITGPRVEFGGSMPHHGADSRAEMCAVLSGCHAWC